MLLEDCFEQNREMNDRINKMKDVYSMIHKTEERLNKSITKIDEKVRPIDNRLHQLSVE